MPVITLLTDFGTKDEYVGVMKGVILSINPSAVIVDISHHIEPQNVLQATYRLRAAYPYFPTGSVHIIVVDPGVGGLRHILAVKTRHGVFIAPDNGVLTATMATEDIEMVVRVEDPRYFLTPVSHTFHGRDIFAPVGARVSAGLCIRRLGPEIGLTETIRLPLPEPRMSGPGQMAATVVDIDGFGNLVTCIDTATLEIFRGGASSDTVCTAIGPIEVAGIQTSYGSVPKGHPLAIIGSRGLLEIGVNGGSAQGYFNVRIGDPVTLMIPVD